MKPFHSDPIWFGVVMTVNLAIGQVTPPMAVNLYVAANLAKIPLEEISLAAIPLRSGHGGRSPDHHLLAVPFPVDPQAVRALLRSRHEAEVAKDTMPGSPQRRT